MTGPGNLPSMGATPSSGSNIGGMEIVLDKDWQGKFTGPVFKTLERLGKQMVAEAQDICPEGPERRDQEPHLNQTIFYEVLQSRGASGQFGKVQLHFGAFSDHALPVEFGHHTTAGGFVPAQPFLRPVAMKKREHF